MELPVILPGKYQTLCRLSVRKGAGLEFPKRKHRFPAYVQILVTEVKYLSVSVWGRTKEGWICMYMNHTFYVEKMNKNNVEEKEQKKGSQDDFP